MILSFEINTGGGNFLRQMLITFPTHFAYRGIIGKNWL